MIRLSPRFTIAELLVTTASKRHLLPLADDLDAAIVDALRALCLDVLEPIRHECGDRSIRVTSGYRTAALNKAISGSATTQHVRGEAVDFAPPSGMRSVDVVQRVVAARAPIPFDQIIAYHPSRGGHVHVSHRAGHNRGEVLVKRADGTYGRGVAAVNALALAWPSA